MEKITDKLSKLTTIPVKALNNLVEKSNWIICDSMYTNLIENIHSVVVDIAIGTLTITDDQDVIRYKFTPSKELEQAILDVCTKKKNPLTINLETALAKKITDTYKDFV